MTSLQGLSALVTGGSRGIGAEIVKLLSEAGCVVYAPTRQELDLANLKSVEEFADGHKDITPDILILNAGQNMPKNIEDVTTSHWLQTFDTNINSSFLLIREFVPRMATKTRGWVTAISSCYSERSREGRAPYSASKAALNSLIRSTALEFATSGILANAVAPGFVLTDLTRQNNTPEGIQQLESRIPLGRLATPSEIARFVVYLSTPTNTYISGQFVAIDGGFLCH